MSDDVTEYVQGLKVTELRDELKKRGLSCNGLKVVLVQRLQEAMISEEQGKALVDDSGTPDEEPSNDAVDSKETDNERVPVENQEPLPDVSADNDVPAAEEQTDNVPETTESVPTSDVPVANDAPPDNTSETSNVPVANDNAPVDNEPVNDVTDKIDDPVTNEAVTDEPSNDQPVDEPVDSSASNELTNADSNCEVSNDLPQTEEEDGGHQVTTAQPTEEEMEVGTKQQVEEEQTEAVEEQKEPVEAMDAESGQVQLSGNHEKMEGEFSESDSRGTKRTHEASRSAEEDEEEKKPKVDPETIPDPESVENWSDVTIQGICDNIFVLPEDSQMVTLNPYKSDLHFIIESDGVSGYSLTEGGFAYMKASAKATIGIKNGCYFYECKVEENLPVNVECPHLVRLGWSTLDSEMVVGDDRFSYCYESTGKKVTRTNPEDYEEEFTQGDIIGCYLKLTPESKVIFFTKNGVRLSDAFDLSDQNFEQSLFPHISIRNVKLSFNFGSNPPSYPPEEGYLLLQEASDEDKEASYFTPVSKNDCEIIMMIGLPSCGKTYWSSRHSARNIDKSYRIIGPYQVLEQMWPEKKNSITDWKSFVDLTSPIVNTLIVLASKLPCNYIVDQVNVYANTRRQRMSYFEGFLRKALVVIPPHHELRKRRSERIRDGGCVDLPQDLMDAFKANFYIPKQEDGIFDEINFSEIYGPASEKIVRQYKDDALGIQMPYMPKRPRYEQRGRNYGGQRSKGGPYGYGPYGSARYYHHPHHSRGGYYQPPPPPPTHYRSYYPSHSPPGGGWGNPYRGRYGNPPPNPSRGYSSPRPYYPPRGGGGNSSSYYYNRY